MPGFCDLMKSVMTSDRNLKEGLRWEEEEGRPGKIKHKGLCLFTASQTSSSLPFVELTRGDEGQSL